MWEFTHAFNLLHVTNRTILQRGGLTRQSCATRFWRSPCSTVQCPSRLGYLSLDCIYIIPQIQFFVKLEMPENHAIQPFLRHKSLCNMYKVFHDPDLNLCNLLPSNLAPLQHFKALKSLGYDTRGSISLWESYPYVGLYLSGSTLALTCCMAFYIGLCLDVSEVWEFTHAFDLLRVISRT